MRSLRSIPCSLATSETVFFAISIPLIHCLLGDEPRSLGGADRRPQRTHERLVRDEGGEALRPRVQVRAAPAGTTAPIPHQPLAGQRESPQARLPIALPASRTGADRHMCGAFAHSCTPSKPSEGCSNESSYLTRDAMHREALPYSLMP